MAASGRDEVFSHLVEEVFGLPRTMEPRKFKCKQCGNCCDYYSAHEGLTLTQDDYQKWAEADADYILAFVKSYRRGGKEYGARKIWRDPKNKTRVLRYCPFLYKKMDRQGKKKWKCGIHSFKPECCRLFMTPEWELDVFGCKGYE